MGQHEKLVCKHGLNGCQYRFEPVMMIMQNKWKEMPYMRKTTGMQKSEEYKLYQQIEQVIFDV